MKTKETYDTTSGWQPTTTLRAELPRAAGSCKCAVTDTASRSLFLPASVHDLCWRTDRQTDRLTDPETASILSCSCPGAAHLLPWTTSVTELREMPPVGWSGLKKDNLATLIIWPDFLTTTPCFTTSRSRQGNIQKLMIWRISKLKC